MRWFLTGDGEQIARQPLQRHVNILAANVALLPPPESGASRAVYDAFASRARGELWWYQDCSQHGCGHGPSKTRGALVPSYAVDATAVQNRVLGWLSFLYGVRGELYYGVDHCWSHACGENGRTRDPWTSVRASGASGDGTLVYPGLPSRIGGKSPTVLASMRLEHVRDGYEDYEYLRLLAARNPREAARLARRFARTVTDFEPSAEALSRTRSEIADALELYSSTTHERR
jgi:hypothetical protein